MTQNILFNILFKDNNNKTLAKFLRRGISSLPITKYKVFARVLLKGSIVKAAKNLIKGSAIRFSLLYCFNL